MIDDLVIIGAGGSAGDIAWTVEEINKSSERWRLRGFVDDDPAKRGGSVCGYPILGPVSAIGDFGGAFFLVAIAHYRRPLARKAVVERIGLPAERFATLVHPSASVSPQARIGSGTVILQQAGICHEASVGGHVFVGLNCVVSHNAVVEDFATMASGAILCGGARLCTGAYAGAGSVIRDGLSVGDGAVAGLGSVVLRDVPPGVVVIGNPAREVPSRAVESSV
jgi:sugar O-acyltransferase (sialic acid O-acetyltransferase NeuD family)